MSLSSLLASAAVEPGRLQIRAPEHWLQGRTAYGGFSCAVAHEAARTVSRDLPPLRSMQATFIGPLAGELEVKTEVLRRGRSAAFVQADVSGDTGLGLRVMFVFAAAREISLAHHDVPAPKALGLDLADTVTPLGSRATTVSFLSNFELRYGCSNDQARAPEMMRWVRLRDRGGLDPTTELLVCGDALPPAAMALMTEPRAISSMTWTMNLLEPHLGSESGWWLLQARAEQIRDGGSSQWRSGMPTFKQRRLACNAWHFLVRMCRNFE